MRTKPKDLGTRFESDVVNTINDWAGEKVCERIVLHGSEDEGDLRLIADDLTICVECKRRKEEPSDKEIAAFKQETIRETRNSMSDGGFLVVNRYRRGTLSSRVYMTHGTHLRIYGVDRLLMDENTEERIVSYINRVLDEAGEHDWVCMSLLDVCWTLYGAPAWENRKELADATAQQPQQGDE